jgi:hypothetical protein
MICLMVCRCRTVVRKPQPETEWNQLQLPTINNVVGSQRWQVSPLYFWFDECTCSKVRRSTTGMLVAAVFISGNIFILQHFLKRVWGQAAT